MRIQINYTPDYTLVDAHVTGITDMARIRAIGSQCEIDRVVDQIHDCFDNTPGFRYAFKSRYGLDVVAHWDFYPEFKADPDSFSIYELRVAIEQILRELFLGQD